jgi:hypothetical protein
MYIVVEVGIIFSSFLFWNAIDKIQIFKNPRIVNSDLINAIIRGVCSNTMCSLYPMVIYENAIIKYSLPFAARFFPLISIGYSSYEMYNRK